MVKSIKMFEKEDKEMVEQLFKEHQEKLLKYWQNQKDKIAYEALKTHPKTREIANKLGRIFECVGTVESSHAYIIIDFKVEGHEKYQIIRLHAHIAEKDKDRPHLHAGWKSDLGDWMVWEEHSKFKYRDGTQWWEDKEFTLEEILNVN